MISHVRAPLARVSLAFVLGGFALMGWSAEAEDDEELAEVQVTGTRIQSPNVTAANPITSITGEEMRRLGIVNVADAITTLVPQNISTYTPALIGDNQSGTGGGGMESLDRGSFFIGNTIANLRGLDPAYGSRTLTLVDGRRQVSSSNQADVVDLNVIPSNLLERMDVVTGGASATYGSGAMAGVVNLVLSRRLTGVNLDLDYGVNEAGDGGSPHVSLSGGTPLFGGKGHMLVGAEWQKQEAIRDCAAARDWCAESRALFNNFSGVTPNVNSVFTPIPGYEGYPARFEMANVRYSQFAPTGTIYFNNSNVTTDYRFNEAGTDIEQYAVGFRGGLSPGGGGLPTAINGDGPLVTSGTPLRPSSERKSVFTNFEYDLTSTTTAYLQASYAGTEGLNRNRYVTGNYCVRFNSLGVATTPGGTARQGEFLTYGAGTNVVYEFGTTNVITNPVRNALFGNANFRAFLGWNGGTLGAPAASPPYWIPATQFAQYGATSISPPTINVGFASGTPVYQHIRLTNATTGVEYWLLTGLTLNANFDDPGTPAVLPEMGRNAYAFLNNLSAEAQSQVQRAFGVAGAAIGSTVHGALLDPTTGQPLSGASITTGGSASPGLETLYGTNACNGYTAMRKVWNPQVQQWTTQEQERVQATLGVKGRFGSDWRWDASYQYGESDSTSKQYNVATNLRLSMAVDAVIDDRVDAQGNPLDASTYGKPICRIKRDGVPVIDYQGRPISKREELESLAAGCVPINLFGTSFASAADTLQQQQAIDYAFVDSVSTGGNSLEMVSLSTNGTLWEGLGAGPLTAAFGLEFREDRIDNQGTSGAESYYERADLARVWADGFGGKTRVAEGYTELNLPLVTGMDALNQFSLNGAVRYSSYYNKGGAGTTGESATQDVLNWKFSAVLEPFDWIRFRLTRSRDLRAAGYRDLFINQPGLPDQFARENPWRERTAFSTENLSERMGQVQVGNPDLKPEKSNTLTLGFVLKPGAWAQGMSLTADYYEINVKDGINVPFRAGNPIRSCWDASGNVEAQYIDGSVDPLNPGVNGLFDANDPACQELTFAPLYDTDGNPIPGSRNLQDVVTYNSARPENSLPYQRRGVDVSWQYLFPLNRAVEGLPGSLSLTIRGTRALESSGIQLNSGASINCNGVIITNGNCRTYRDLVGQIRSSVFIPGVSATPKWSGNIIAGYLLGDLSTSLSARYIGGASLDNTWSDEAGEATYQNASGQLLAGSVDNNWVKPYVNFSLNGSYNLRVANTKQFQVFGSVSNLFDKTPPFTGGGVSGASAQYNDTFGRAYRMGLRLKF